MGSFENYRNLVRSDLYRYHGKVNLLVFFRLLLFHPGFKVSFWMRTVRYLNEGIVFRVTLYPLARVIYQLHSTRLGVEIPFRTNIGPGLYIGHYSGIVVHYKSVIGKNCNLLQGVTVGRVFRGDKKGVPTIGDNVFIGPGAVILGNIRVGNNVAIGANSVIVEDVPDGAVIAGIPGKVVSDKGSDGYLHHLVLGPEPPVGD